MMPAGTETLSARTHSESGAGRTEGYRARRPKNAFRGMQLRRGGNALRYILLGGT